MRRFVLLSAVAGGLLLQVLGLQVLGVSSAALAEPPVRIDENPIAGNPAAGGAVSGAVVAPLAVPASETVEPSNLTAGIGLAAESQAGTEALAKPKPPAPPAVVARINLSSQRMEVSVNGASVHSWAISSGRAGYASPRGTWRVQWTSRIWYSKKYDNAPMPHAVFFTGGVAVHATSAVGMLGRPASHGCIRLAPANAAQFYALVQKHGIKQTQIQVFGSPPTGAVASRRDRDRDEDQGRGSRPDRRRVAGRRVAALDEISSTVGPDSYVQNGIRYVRVR